LSLAGSPLAYIAPARILINVITTGSKLNIPPPQLRKERPVYSNPL